MENNLFQDNSCIKSLFKNYDFKVNEKKKNQITFLLGIFLVVIGLIINGFMKQLDDFYQAHKNFVEGFSRQQLNGKRISLKQAHKECRQAVFNKEFDLDPSVFPPNQIANPCGLLAKYYPRDEYLYIQNVDSEQIIDISLESVADPYFAKNFKRSNQQRQWTDIEDPRFINWMKNSSTKNFRKLWGYIDQEIPKGEYQVFIKNGQNYEEMEFLIIFLRKIIGILFGCI